eukprot:CAMPEP_0197051464 /NCGR_PEP_ID=MMETSP1384-20130603/26131_1 /TAXON_ID=29189 /ORGANISM="Ammonia sp." /LENGTH=501 /DNA_ID=CAMNT_0042484033 /DNA_START=31 /DNA_END=1536 /DNA_ORIENTATION=-
MGLAEIVLTLLLTAGIGTVVFLVFFNTRQIEVDNKDKKQNKQKAKKPAKKKAKKSGHKISIKHLKQKGSRPSDFKAKIKLEDHDNLVSVFRGHTNDVTSVAWHQSGEYLFSSSKDKLIFVWEQPTKSTITDYDAGSIKTEDNGYCSALHTIVTVDEKDETQDQYVEDTKEAKTDNPLADYSEIANTLIATTSGSFGLNSYLFRWAPSTKPGISTRYELELTSRTQTEFAKEDVQCICAASDLSFVCLSGMNDTKIYVYDVKGKQRQSRGANIDIPAAPTNKAQLKRLLSTVDKPMEVVEGGQFVVHQMNVSRDGQYLSIGSFKKDVRLWRVNYIKPGKRDIIQEPRYGSLESLCTILNAHTASVTCVTFSCDSKYMISASKDGQIKIWDIINCDYQRGKTPPLVFEQNLEIGSIDYLCISYQYDIIAVMNEQRKDIYVYRLKCEKKKIKLHCTYSNVLSTPKNVEARINCIAFAPNSQYIAVASSDFDVRVYQIPAHKKKH